MLRASFASILALAATVSAQAVTSAIAPQGGAPAGCYPNYRGSFAISTPNVTESGLERRQNTALGITLVDGILKDPQGRIGYIAANSQFQFDGPPQAGAIYTAGWSVCANGSLAIGDDVSFFKCLSGTFYNLYLDNDAGQCIECYLVASPLAAGDGPVAGPVTPSVSPTGSVAPSSAPNATITTSTRNGTMSMSMSSSSGATGGGMTGKTTTLTGVSTTTAKTTKPAKTTTGGGSGGTGAAASSSSSSTGLAAAIGPVGDVFGIFAGLLAFAVI